MDVIKKLQETSRVRKQQKKFRYDKMDGRGERKIASPNIQEWLGHVENSRRLEEKHNTANLLYKIRNKYKWHNYKTISLSSISFKTCTKIIEKITSKKKGFC